MSKIDLGNVRGIKGDRGEKGERGGTPSYDDLRYVKRNDEFVTLKTNLEIHQYYLDANNNLCDEEGHILDENKNPTDTIGEPFNVNVYGYRYKPIWMDTEGNITNVKGDLLDENGDVQYIESDFISDVTSYIYEDEEAYDKLVSDVYPHVTDTLVSANPNDEKYSAFFDEIEGDIKYYFCADDPKDSIYIENNVVKNECKYKDEDGNLVKDGNGNNLYVPLEKNTLYLYSNQVYNDNDVMHYDIYLCTKAGTVPKKLVSKNEFVVDYNVIDDLRLVPNNNNDDVILELYTRGTRGQFYSMSEVDGLFNTHVTSKLGVNNGIAQLNSSGKVPSSQLPAYIDDVIEGTMNSNATTFTPTESEYIDSVQETGKIYVDTSTKKTYRWTGSMYALISNPINVDDGSDTAYSSSKGGSLETLIGNSNLSTTNKNITGAINELKNAIDGFGNLSTIATTGDFYDLDNFPFLKLGNPQYQYANDTIYITPSEELLDDTLILFSIDTTLQNRDNYGIAIVDGNTSYDILDSSSNRLLYGKAKKIKNCLIYYYHSNCILVNDRTLNNNIDLSTVSTVELLVRYTDETTDTLNILTTNNPNSGG